MVDKYGTINATKILDALLRETTTNKADLKPPCKCY